MVNPVLLKKSNINLTVTPQVKELFRALYAEQNKEEKTDDEVPKIRVSEIVSKMAFYYEKIRNSVDYEEEHLLRKNAIERILRRQILIEGAIAVKTTTREMAGEEIASHLLAELIRAGYLPNNKIPETKIKEIGQVIEKYLRLRQASAEAIKQLSIKEKNEFNKWIIALAASDIEEHFGRSQVDLVIIDYMYDILAKNIKMPPNSPYQNDKEIQVFIGIYRSYLKFDRDMLGFLLLKHYHSNWQNPTTEEIANLGANILTWRAEIERQIDHPLAGQFNRIISRYTVYFSILKDTIADDPIGVYESIRKDPKAFPRRIKRIAEKKYKIAKSKLWRAAVRSIIYIFITKSIFAVLLEVPASKFFGEEVNNFALGINISFPAILLFMFVLFSRMPGPENTEKIIEGINEIVFEEYKHTEPFQLRVPVKRGKMLNAIFGVIYSITFFLSFGFVVWFLDKIGFSWVSTTIFLFFLALVSFFSIRIRKNTRELLILEPKENIFSFIADFFYVPVVAAGKWLSENFSRVNVFVFILDFIIEAPFKIFVEIAEEWTKYVKERKEEIV
jgi:hypothetical protein